MHSLQVVSLLKKSLDAYKTDGHTDRVLCIENHPGRSKFDCSSVKIAFTCYSLDYFKFSSV